MKTSLSSGMNILGTICARGGSKGLVGKNLKDLGGRPLIEHSLDQALLAGIFKKIVVSSDCPEIQKYAAKKADLIIKRPPELALDTSAKLPVIKHALLKAEEVFSLSFDIVVDLDVTSPLRSVEDIKKATAKLIDEDLDNVLTVCKARKTPYFNQASLDERGYAILPIDLNKQKVTRRQDAPLCYDLNASIYPFKREALLRAETVFLEKTGLYEMPFERSIDIDSEVDFFLVESLYSSALKEGGGVEKS